MKKQPHSTADTHEIVRAPREIRILVTGELRAASGGGQEVTNPKRPN